MRLLNFFTGRRRRNEKRKNVRVVRFDGALTREEVHDRLREALGVPGYSGSNLDALYDVLTSISAPTHVLLSGLDRMTEPLLEYGERIRAVFRDAAAENPALTYSAEDEGVR